MTEHPEALESEKDLLLRDDWRAQILKSTRMHSCATNKHKTARFHMSRLATQRRIFARALSSPSVRIHHGESISSLQWLDTLSSTLATTDPEVFDIIEKEKRRQRDSIALIPSEVF